MDILFTMERYWGSDEEVNNEEENENISNSDISECENFEPHKKRKVDSSLTENDGNSCVKKSRNDVDRGHETITEVIAEKTVSLSKTVNVGYWGSHEEVNNEEIEYISNSYISENENFESHKKKKVDSSVTENDGNSFVKKNHNNVDRAHETMTEVIAEKTVSLNKIVDVKKRIPPTKGKEHKSQETQKQGRSTEELNISNSLDETMGENFSTIGQVQSGKDVKIRHALPHWLSNPTYIGINLQEEETPVSELNYLDSNSKKNLEEEGIKFLFPVQLAVIPWLMQSKEQSLLNRPSDICVSAPTGSGKTLAFVLPIVQSLKDRVVCAIRALVVLPVNELAIQVFKVFETFVRGTDLKVALLTGQKSFLNEQNLLIRSNEMKVNSMVDIIVTTPGRIYDHIYKTKGFCLKRLRYLVIDEADRMLEEIQQGWLKQVENAVFNDCVFSNCGCSSVSRISHEPSSAYNFGFISQPLQKLLYSATLTQDPEQLHSLSLYKPKLFTASWSSDKHLETCAIPPGLTMLQIVCDVQVKPMIICHFIKQHNLKRVLCFTETVELAHRLHLLLEEMGLLQVREISSSNRAIQRKIVLEQFSSGKVDILVCSDLVARGIDIENIDCVISYDIPQSIKLYIHRVGRTARAGKTGKAVTLLTSGEIPHFKKILKSAGIEMPKKFNMNFEELLPLYDSYRNALMNAHTKLKNERKQLSRKPSRKQLSGKPSREANSKEICLISLD